MGNLREELVSFGKESQLFSDIAIRSFGKQSGDPFQLLIKARGPKANIMDVGYGVNQILPLLVDTIRARSRRAFLLQQPEVHLHPKGQAALANLFAALTKSRGHSFLIETHSDYIVNHARLRPQRRNRCARCRHFVFCARQKKRVKIHPIELDEGGQIKNPPRGYRDFFSKEINKVLGFSD